MAGFAPKLHLPFAAWPEADKALWQYANEADDPFSEGGAAHLSAASKERYLMGWRRFLGFLALHEPEALEISPLDRLHPERLRAFARHLAETCSPATVALGVEAAYHAARVMLPAVGLGWLKKMKTRLHAAVPPRSSLRPAITSLQLLNLGLELMDEVPLGTGKKLRLKDAVQYRDGLILALTAFAPLRRKNLADLDLLRHVRLGEGRGEIVIPSTDTKTDTPVEFEVAEELLPYVQAYCTSVRPRIFSDKSCTALWVSAKGGALSYEAIWFIFARHSERRLGVRLRPHDVRAAAGTTWAVHKPEQIEVAQELLGHTDIRTTTVHYNRARGIQASRSYLKALVKARQQPQRD